LSTQGAAPSEEELRAAYEEELSRLTSTDVMAQAAVSLLNLGARRLAPDGGEQAGERDLEQARDAIDGARALLEILERRIPQELRPLRDALSRLQMAYAREVGAAGGEQQAAAGAAGARDAGAGQAGGAGEGEPGAAGEGRPGGAGEGRPGSAGPAERQERGPGPAESSGRLWVPGR